MNAPMIAMCSRRCDVCRSASFGPNPFDPTIPLWLFAVMVVIVAGLSWAGVR